MPYFDLTYKKSTIRDIFQTFIPPKKDVRYSFRIDPMMNNYRQQAGEPYLETVECIEGPIETLHRLRKHDQALATRPSEHRRH